MAPAPNRPPQCPHPFRCGGKNPGRPRRPPRPRARAAERRLARIQTIVGVHFYRPWCPDPHCASHFCFQARRWNSRNARCAAPWRTARPPARPPTRGPTPACAPSSRACARSAARRARAPPHARPARRTASRGRKNARSAWRNSTRPRPCATICRASTGINSTSGAWTKWRSAARAQTARAGSRARSAAAACPWAPCSSWATRSRSSCRPAPRPGRARAPGRTRTKAALPARCAGRPPSCCARPWRWTRRAGSRTRSSA